MTSAYHEKFTRIVLEYSQSSIWENAVNEWVIADCEEDINLESACICGKEQLRYLFTIRNKYTHSVLFPIGSSCIKKFGRDDLNGETLIQEGMFKLFHAVESNQFISLTTDLFSRNIIHSLHKQGAFDTEYNKYDGTGDYDFFMKMFNKQDKDSITNKQQSKIRAIIGFSIRPFLVRNLRDKSH